MRKILRYACLRKLTAACDTKKIFSIHTKKSDATKITVEKTDEMKYPRPLVPTVFADVNVLSEAGDRI